MRYILPIVLAFTLTGCQSNAERQRAWVSKCQNAQFTMEQCWILLSIKEDAKRDSDSNTVLTSTAIGIGLGVSAAGRR